VTGGSEPERFSLDIPALDPIAVRVVHAIGPYQDDTILVANRLRGKDTINAHGTDCLAAVEGGPVLLRRVVAGQNDTVTLVPLSSGHDVRYDQKVAWLARIVMAIRYL
jgi:hypothetical protein